MDLSAEEVMLLSDRIKGEDVGTPDMKLFSYKLLDKLGSVFLELVQDDHKESGIVAVVLTEPELRWCRDKVSTSDRTSEQPLLGVCLLRKLYTAILSLEDPPLLPVVEHTEPDRQTLKDALIAWEITGQRSAWEDMPQ